MTKIRKNSFSTMLDVVKKGTVATLCMVMVGLFFAVGCSKDDREKSNVRGGDDFRIYYVAGYDASSGVIISKGTAKSGGYLFVSENSEDTLYASNVTELDNGLLMCDVRDIDELFVFPEGIMPINICGFNFFPEEYQFVYKIQMSHRPMTEEEEMNTYHMCSGFYQVLYPNIQPKRIVIESISKI